MANRDNELVLYTAGTDTEVKVLDDQKADIVDFDISVDDKYIAGIGGKTITIWDLTTMEVFKSIEAPIKLNNISFIHNDRIAVSGDNILLTFDVKTGGLLYEVAAHRKDIVSLAVSQDGQWIATGGEDKQFAIFKSVDGTEVKRISQHEDWVSAMDFSRDSKLFATGSYDKSVKVWEVGTWELLKTIDESSAWVTALSFSEDGSILGIGNEKDECIFYSMEYGRRVLLIDDFRNKIQSLEFSIDGKMMVASSEYENNIKIWDVTTLGISPVFNIQDESDVDPPAIYISSPSNIRNEKLRYFNDILDIKGVVIDDAGVMSLKINGQKIKIKENGNFVFRIPLTPGENFMRIEASDINGNTSLKQFTVQKLDEDGNPYIPAKATNYLFVVGINDYISWPQLNNAVKDAEDVVNVLTTQYKFEPENVVFIKNENATKSNIYNEMRNLIERVTSQDNLMIYFSGHGHFDDKLNEGYWIPIDAGKGAPEDYIPNSYILKIIENIDSQHTFLVADACFSGSLFSGSSRGYADNVERFRSRWGLASGRLETVSDGDFGSNSPFARSFITFLSKNEKEKISVSELVTYVKLSVAETSNQTPIGNPLRTAGDEGGEFVFYKRDL